jgi:hypothetical protein
MQWPGIQRASNNLPPVKKEIRGQIQSVARLDIHMAASAKKFSKEQSCAGFDLFDNMAVFSHCCQGKIA